MNRHDEIQAVARDIASNVHLDPVKRDAMADDLIKLIGLMLAAQGKYLAVYAEGEMNDWLASGHRGGAKRFESIYKTGERMQDSARELVSECTNPKVDLERWTRPTPGDPCQCGHVPSVHKDGVCTGESYNREACVGGPCTDFVRKERTYGWFHQDRRPATFRTRVNSEDEQAIRDIVRDEIGRAVQRQEAMQKAALQQHWDSDAFKSQVDALREGRPVKVPVKRCGSCGFSRYLREDGSCSGCNHVPRGGEEGEGS